MAHDKLRVTATGAGVAYYPEFVARELGYFEDEGLVVETRAPGHGPWVARDLDTDAADVALGGIWRPLMYRGRLSTYYAFAQLCARCPLYLLSRNRLNDFSWPDLFDKIVLVSDGAPSPYMIFRAVLEADDVDLRRIRLLQDLLAPEATELFQAGLGDFYLTGPPTSTQLIADGVAYSAVSIAEKWGPLPWSVYYARPEYLKDPRQPATRFTRAIQRALRWVLTNEPEAAPGVMKTHFPTSDPKVIAEAVRGCRDTGVWIEDVGVDSESLLRWQQVTTRSALIDGPIAYDEIVDSGPAQAASKEG